MKKITIVLLAGTLLIGCANSSVDNKNNNADSTGLANPVAGDTIKQPSGVNNSSAISTDTAAMNVQNTIRKKDSLDKKANK